MIPVNSALLAFALYVPVFIGLYILVLFTIFKRRKDSCDSSFYQLFSIIGVVNISACLVCTFIFRLPKYPLVNDFYSSLTSNSWWLNAVNTGAYFLISLSEFLGVLLALNRCTALYLPQWHEQIWRRFLLIGVVLCCLVSLAPVWHIIGGPTMFNPLDGPHIGYTFYYIDSVPNTPQNSVWLNMVWVCAVSSGTSTVLYIACLIRLRCCSAIQSPKVQRRLFVIAVLTMLFSLPYTIAMAVFYYNISVGRVTAENADFVQFWAFLHPWLLDLMQLTPAPMLLVTSKTMRVELKKMFSSNYD